jgi:predicted dehydrogenase
MQMKSSVARIPRRTFLGHSLVTAGSLMSCRLLRAAPGAANQRIGLGFIGAGGRAQHLLGWFSQQADVQVTAICDVDQRHLDQVRPKVPSDCQLLADYRELLELPGIDAVLIATPDHWHGRTAVAAARAGKHIYCEKPLTNSIGEGRAVCDAVKQAGVVFQTGSHERSNPGARVAKQLIEEGRFGKIKRVRIQLPTDDPHLLDVARLESPPPTMEVPAGFDYDFWLGHTPEVPYTEKRCHFWWRFHSAYGGGEMTDRGAHVIDLAQMILGLDHTGPVSIKAKGAVSPSGFYDAFMKFDFENKYESGLLMTGDNTGPRGVWLEGDKGSLFIAVHGAALVAEPASLLEGVNIPNATSSNPHCREFLDAIQKGTAVVAPAEAGHRTASICHLNNIAMRLGRPFEWDPVSERTNDDEANSMLMPKMRYFFPG